MARAKTADRPAGKRAGTRYIALLRAVNLGAHNKVSMADLRDLCGRLGFTDATTLLQSGNVVFRAGAREGAAAIEKRLEAGAKQHLGLETDFFVRDADEWRELIAANPFPDAAARDPGHLVVLALKDAPPAAAITALQAAIAGRETVRAIGRALYAVYPDGIGRSKLTNVLIEKKLGTRCTGRNWNTVLKLADVGVQAEGDVGVHA